MFVDKLNSSRQTIEKSVASAALDYINATTADEEGLEKLQVHSSLLLSVLASICDLDVNHTAFPWKIAAAIDSSQLPDLLKYMKEEWEFVRAVVDTLHPKDQLWKLLSHTRWQVYRDILTKGEYHCCTRSVEDCI